MMQMYMSIVRIAERRWFEQGAIGGEVRMTPEEAYRAGYQAGRLSMPEIVRCKDCKKATHFETEYGNEIYMCDSASTAHYSDWFCADGEQK